MTSSLGQASLVVQWKRICLPCRRWVEPWVRSLGWGDPLEERNDTLSSLLAWKFPWTEEPGGSSPWGHRGVRHDLATEQQQFFRSHSSERSREVRRAPHGVTATAALNPQAKKKKKRERETVLEGYWRAQRIDEVTQQCGEGSNRKVRCQRSRGSGWGR